MNYILDVNIVNGNFIQKILKYFIPYVTKMIVKITNVVKKIVILLLPDGMLVVHIYGRFIKSTLICLTVKYVIGFHHLTFSRTYQFAIKKKVVLQN